MSVISMKDAKIWASVSRAWKSLYSVKWLSTPLAAFVFPVLFILADVVPISPADEWFTNMLYSNCNFKNKFRT